MGGCFDGCDDTNDVTFFEGLGLFGWQIQADGRHYFGGCFKFSDETFWMAILKGLRVFWAADSEGKLIGGVTLFGRQLQGIA